MTCARRKGVPVTAPLYFRKSSPRQAAGVRTKDPAPHRRDDRRLNGAGAAGPRRAWVDSRRPGRRDALDGAGSPRLVLVREPDQLGVEPAHPQLAFGVRLVELAEPNRHGAAD